MKIRSDMPDELKLTDTPLRPDAFALSAEQKIKTIAYHFGEIMTALGLDMSDDSLKGTPLRVAKMYVNEAFGGLNPADEPTSTLFDNKYNYNQVMVERNITLFTYCEHHFVPIIGKVHVGYISNGKVIGLSKINRLVQYYAKRPQVQERLTQQIAESLQKAIGTKDVAVVIDAVHLCVAARGIKDTNSSTVTASYSGKFNVQETKAEFVSLLTIK